MSPRKPPPRTLGIVLEAVASSPQPIRTLIVAQRAWDRGLPGLSVDATDDALAALSATGMVRRVPPGLWTAGPYRIAITERMEQIYAPLPGPPPSGTEPAVTCGDAGDADSARARAAPGQRTGGRHRNWDEYRPELGRPDDVERARLLRDFCPELRRARTHRLLSQRRLAELAGLSARTIERLERGHLRPTAASLRKIVRVLDDDLIGQVASFDRLREAAGDSFRDYSRKPYRRREALRAALRAAQGEGPLIGPGDSLGEAVAANLAEMARRGRDG